MAKLKDWLCRMEYRLLSGTDEAEVDEVFFDSRKARKNSVFVCIGGSRIDSHDFIADVFNKGCSTFVVEKELSELKLPQGELNIIKVENSRAALAYLSQARFGYPAEKMKMIGITGTKGKTTVSNIISSVITLSGKKVGVIGTNGCFIGNKHTETKNTTPESYELHEKFSEMVEAGCEYAVIECSSQGFKMHRTDGIRFDYGIFLNLSPDHIGPLEHKDFDEYMRCKAELLNQSDKLVINVDDEHAEEVLRIYADKKNIKINKSENIGELIDELNRKQNTVFRSVSLMKKAYLYAEKLCYSADSNFVGTEFEIFGSLHSGEKMSISLPGDFNVLNALCAECVLEDAGIDFDTVKKGFRSIYVKGRMETVYKSDRLQVIIDYAHNEVSMENLLNTLRKYEPARLVIVFGCGGNRSADRRTGMGRQAAFSADFTVLTADNSRFEKTEDIIRDIHRAYSEAGGNEDKIIEIPDRREAIRYAMLNAKDGDMVAVIGKGHEEYQEENGIRTHFSDGEEIAKAAEMLELKNGD